MSIRILIADRHDMFREVLQRLLELEAEFTIVGDTGDGEELLKLIGALKPDVLLLGDRLRRRSGTELLREIDDLHLDTRPILLTDDDAQDRCVDVLCYGVRGLVWKHEPPSLLFKSIRTVMAGEYWISRQGVRQLVENLRSLTGKVAQNAQQRTHSLSRQQQQIVDLIAAGCSNKDIAKDLAISERTVKYHLTQIFSKLGITGRMQLARFALNSNPSLTEPNPVAK
jgi:two-component system, NarL family, nitrate/nitrite response regulator NarL